MTRLPVVWPRRLPPVYLRAVAFTAGMFAVLPAAAQDNGPPVFSGPSTVSVVENKAGGFFYAQAEDPDVEDLPVSYAIKATNDSNLFEIGSSSGSLSFKNPPDHETPQDSDADNIYLVDVTAASGTGSRQRSAERQFTITVTDRVEKPNKMAAPNVDGAPGSITATWTEPDNTGLPPIVSYRAQLRLAGSGGNSNEAETDNLSHTFNALYGRTPEEAPLPPGIWEVRVRTQNEDAPSGKVEGPWSDWAQDAVGDVAASVNPMTLQVGTSGTTSYNVALSAKPGGNVNVVVTPDTSGTGSALVAKDGGTASASVTLNFTSTNWNQAQTVTVSGQSAGSVKIAHDPSGSGWDIVSATEMTVTVVDGDPNNPPAFDGSATASFAEEQETTAEVLTAAANDPDSQETAVSYAIKTDSGGAATKDGALFDLTSAGVLTFKAIPNHEDPKDADTDNVYRVDIVATSGENTRKLSAEREYVVTVTDVMGEAPPRPDTPTVATGGSGELKVTWSAASPGRGLAIDGYAVAYHLASGGGWTLVDVKIPDPLAHTLTGLVNSSAYKVYLGVKSADMGVSGWQMSATPADGTPAKDAGGRMGPPTGFAVDPGDSMVGLVWKVPEETEGEQPSGNSLSVKGTSDDNDDDTPAPVTLTGYEVGYTQSGSEWSAGDSQAVDNTSASIAELVNGQAYDFRVRALAGEETGDWSTTLTATPQAPASDAPVNVSATATAATAWKTLDVLFDAPAANTDWILANTEYRVLGLKKGAKRTGWRTLTDVSETGGRVSASTRGNLAIGRVYEVELRFCGESPSDANCSSASLVTYGATPASAPTDAAASAADPASPTALKLTWSIANTGGNKNLWAAYELGYSSDTDATEPATLVDAANAPAFGATETELGGLEGGTEYRLFVRSTIAHQGARLFASPWVSATATTAPAASAGPSYEGVESPALSFTAGTAITPVTLPEASGGSGTLTYTVAPALGNGLAFDTATRNVSGTPAAAADAASYTLTAADTDGNTADLAFTVTVTEAADTTAPTVALAVAEDVGNPAVGAFGITITFSETVTGFTAGDLTVANGAASGLAGSDASWTATITPNDGFSGNTKVDMGADAVEDAAGNGNTAASTLTVAVVPPVTKPTNVESATTAATAWKSLDVTFDAPPASTDWVAASSQIRVLGQKTGATRTGWKTLKTVSVQNGRANASTGPSLAVGRVYEVELRYCGASSDVACSEASDMIYSTTPASAPSNAKAGATDPASETALKLSWTIANTGGKKNLQAAYEIGWSDETGAAAPKTLLDIVPGFGATEAEISGLEAGKAYKLFVRSTVDWQGSRLFASNWASATATTAAGADGLASDALKNALAREARQLLEDASAVIGSRMTDASTGSDALTAFAGLFGQQGPGGCPLAESIEDCVTRGSGGGIAALFNPQGGFGAASDPFSLAQQGSGFAGGAFGFDSQGGFGTQDGFGAQDQSFGFAELRERAKHGFAISLNQPLPQPGAQFTQDMAPVQDDMQLTLWGQAAPGLSQGTMFWGMDAQRPGRWMTGLAFAESTGSTTSVLSRGNGRVSGFAESEVTAVYPYARGRIASGLDVWSLAGWGQGRLASRWAGQSDVSGPEEVIDLHGGLAFSMGLAGAEQRLYEHGGFSVSAVGDAGWSRLAVSGGTADGVAASVHRTRAAVEGRWLSDAWTSNLRVGGRVDGGDGETASGAELSGDVLHSWGRWEAGLQGRWYSANTAEATAGGFGDQGVRAALGLRSAADGTGLAFTLSPGWGTAGLSHAAGAAPGAGLLDALPGNMPAAGVTGDAATAPGAHINGLVSWGAGVDGLLRGQEILRPYAEFSISADGTRHIRTGLSLEGPLWTSLALERRESAFESPSHGLMLMLDTRF